MDLQHRILPKEHLLRDIRKHAEEISGQVLLLPCDLRKGAVLPEHRPPVVHNRIGKGHLPDPAKLLLPGRKGKIQKGGDQPAPPRKIEPECDQKVNEPRDQDQKGRGTRKKTPDEGEWQKER